MTLLTSPRGPLSEFLLEELRTPPHRLSGPQVVEPNDPFADDDLHLALYLCYELHYRGLPGVDDRWEWDPSLLAFRGELEQQFEAALRDTIPLAGGSVPVLDVQLVLRAITEQDGPSVASYVQREATIEQTREFLVHRSAYQLKEADPHAWAIPRLSGAPKAALVEVEADEYGGGRAEWIHADLFARAMAALGLDPTYNAYLDVIPGISLAQVNLMSLFGLHRRWIGAIVGHLALFEMESSIPNRRYGDGLRRLGFSGDATLFFDEHVEADAVHENIASVDLAGGLVRQDPSHYGPILWGAQCSSYLAACWAQHLLNAWAADETSLLAPIAASDALAPS
jgi:hypothetical protein